jgi:hypothetical protein
MAEPIKVRIQILRHRDSDLLVAFSDDLPGLYVQGRSEEELARRIPIVMRDLLEAQGKIVARIERGEDDTPDAFLLSRLTFTALAA